MFGSLVQKLQSLSPIGSPATSPSTSPKLRRKFQFRTPSKLRRRDEYREVQSDPEADYGTTKKEKRKTSNPEGKAKTFLESVYDVPPRRRSQEGSSTLGRLRTGRQVQRLAQYEKYFQDLLAETSSDHPEVEEISRVKAKVRQMVSRQGGDEEELEKIQELFPGDHLGLYDREPSNSRMKGLMRKRSTTAARLQRALSAKSVKSPGSGHDDNKENTLPPPPRTPNGKLKRQFVMETAVLFTTGVQSQERHLFLFTDMLLIAKARSGGHFKLKEKVRLSEMWMASCVDEVSEVPKDNHLSFVVGWPTTNVVATFGCPATRDLWYNKLQQMIGEERDKEPKSTTIQLMYFDVVNNIDFCKTMNVTSTMTANDCIHAALSQLEMHRADQGEFQLWVRTGGDDAPYPLIGHEYPFAIKLNCVRDFLLEDGVEMDHCNNIYNSDPITRCQFILRNARKPSFTPSPESSKKTKKLRKSPIKIHKVFRRTNSKSDSIDSAISTCSGGLLFGQPLSRLCETEPVPKPVLDMLMQLFLKGPFTVGIFRKSANARIVREMRDKLDGELDVDMEAVAITVVAALVKDFLRSLPDCLLCCEFYDDWLESMDAEEDGERLTRVHSLCGRLPKPHVALLCHFLCVCYHIARRSHENMMSASNLAVCVGPSILWPANPALSLSTEASKQVPSLVEFLIDRCIDIFGHDVIKMLGEPPEKEARLDSGAEESDSIHSSGGMRRDDSSIDSLERELIGEPSALPRKDKMSLTNLSRDSGLTMSDTQLYTPDEEESESTSSGHGSDQHYPAPNNPSAIYTAICRRRDEEKAHHHHQKLTATYSAEYTRVYPNSRHGRYSDVYKHDDEPVYAKPPVRLSMSQAEFVNTSNFQRQDWMRQRSNLRKLSKGVISPSQGGGVGLMRRSASEESLYNSHYMIGKRPALHQKGKAPPPPEEEMMMDEGQVALQRSPSMVRSKSAHQISERPAERRHHRLHRQLPARDSEDYWQRSQSTPHIDEVDRSYDSSTLSDDDSTPHVSRSNSRSKDCTAANDLWEKTYGLCLDNHSDTGSRHSSFKSTRTGSFSTVRSADTSSTLSGTPPTYEMALSRRSRLHKSSSSGNMNGQLLPEQTIHEQTILSARAKQLYEESLRIYNEQHGDRLVHASPVHLGSGEQVTDGTERPPPLPPKGDPPPLPPKQRNVKRLRSSEVSTVKLKHLPPVHVNLKTSGRRSQNGQRFTESVYITSDGRIYSENSPPALPPKERTIIQIEPVYAQVPRPSRASRHKLSRSVEKTSVQTQTDEHESVGKVNEREEVGCEQEDCHVTLVEIETQTNEHQIGPSERRGRARRRERAVASSQQRSKSVPPQEKGDSDSESESESWQRAHSQYLQQDEDSCGGDPTLRSEISWSVSKLRAIFGDSSSSNSGDMEPPPYRHPPPIIPSHRAPITSYHLSNSQSEVYVSRKGSGHNRSDSQGSSSYGEESYV